MLADKDVHGAVLESGYTSRLRKDVDTGDRAPGHLEAVARLLFDDAGVGPILKVAEYLGIILDHFNRLVRGFFKVSAECRSKEAGSVTEQLLVHAEYLLLRPDFNLDDRIKRVPVRELGKEMALPPSFRHQHTDWVYM